MEWREFVAKTESANITREERVKRAERVRQADHAIGLDLVQEE